MRGVGEEGPSQVVPVVKNLPAEARDVRGSGLIPGSGRSPGGGNGNPLPYSCLGNPVDGGARQVIVHRAEKTTLEEGLEGRRLLLSSGFLPCPVSLAALKGETSLCVCCFCSL